MTLHKVEIKKTTEYKANDLIALVFEVENYMSFLPWVKAVKIWNRDQTNNSFDAQLLIGYKAFRVPFATNVTKTDNSIVTKLINGDTKRSLLQPLKALNCNWYIKDLEQNCKIDLKIEMEFSDAIIGNIVGKNLQKVSAKLVEAFMNEAKKRFENY